MIKTRATSDEWAQYYDAADRVRAIVGDPFRQYVRRAAARERVLLIASGLLMVILAAVFLSVVGP